MVTPLSAECVVAPPSCDYSELAHDLELFELLEQQRPREFHLQSEKQNAKDGIKKILITPSSG
jgi:hypothetical protein